MGINNNNGQSNLAKGDMAHTQKKSCAIASIHIRQISPAQDIWDIILRKWEVSDDTIRKSDGGFL